MTIEQELIEQKLFELLEEHNFNELSIDEKAFVLRQMDESDYESQRESIVFISDLESQETLERVPIRDFVEPVVEEENTWLIAIQNLFRFKVPAVAFLLPIVMLVGIFVFNNTSSNNSSTEVILAANVEVLEDGENVMNLDTLKSILEDTLLSIEPKRLAQITPEKVNTSSMLYAGKKIIAKAPIEKNTTGTTGGLSMSNNSYSKYATTIYRY